MGQEIITIAPVSPSAISKTIRNIRFAQPHAVQQGIAAAARRG